MLSPMMQHYLETKKENPDCLLFYRLGDFYEMFFDDAITVSRELDLVLTGKDCGLEERAPMCGVPYHAVDMYLNKLVEKGYKVAIAEQMEDPRFAKGLVKREVVRVVTAGTVLSEEALDAAKNNYLMAVIYTDRAFGLAITDISTGAFYVTEADSLCKVEDEIDRYQPAEIVCNEAFLISGISENDLKQKRNIMITTVKDCDLSNESSIRLLRKHFKLTSLATMGLDGFPDGALAAGVLLNYLYRTQKNSIPQITGLTAYRNGGTMFIDAFTRRNLELTETLREKEKRGTLLWVLDRTKTAMGARALRRMIEQPLLDKALILKRQDAVQTLYDDLILREELREYLAPIRDLERLMGRVAYGTVNPRELIALSDSLRMITQIKQTLAAGTLPALQELNAEIDDLPEIREKIEAAIDPEPEITVKEGGIIRDGYNADVDSYRRAKNEGKTWIAALEAEERERTGIKNLRIRYNRVFGYYLEVTSSYKNLVPEDYIRKQTLVNAERYTTARLKDIEATIIGAEEKLNALEYELYKEVCALIASRMQQVQQTARAVAELDVYASLADAAVRFGYVRPKINENGVIDIKDGRHPVVERMLSDGSFVANDTFLNDKNERISIITGPNMAGKSTYMRQTALIVLMAQMGSFVPASKADICLCDRIFTRVGASDDLASGQSTFMVEMTEVANILKYATKKSLIILDEIGRGTSTFDGLSIAWSVIEYISNDKKLGAKTLFATHYHELTELEGSLKGVVNHCIAVREQGDDIVFLRKIIKGGADRSYGIQVAKLAGLPDEVIVRAKDLLLQLLDADITERAKEIVSRNEAQRPRKGKPDDVELGQLNLFDTVREDDILAEIKELELGRLTPIDALNLLYRWQSKLNNRWKE